MFTLTQRLATLGAKSKSATRTAKDGEEYSQLVIDIEGIELKASEVCDLFASAKAWDALLAATRDLKGVSEFCIDEKFEGSHVVMRVAAVDAQNGPEFTFAGSTIDRVVLKVFGDTQTASSALCNFRVTAKPALDAKFGDLISRLGHTVTLEVRAVAPSAQAEMPLENGHDDDEGLEAPTRRRRTREQRIAQQIVDERARETVN